MAERSAGILMHISSLPGKYGIGDFGPEAYRFADFLKQSGQSYWQILPLSQVSELYGYSPYSALSAFAGNVSFISPELLAGQNLIGQLHKNAGYTRSGKVSYKAAGIFREKIIKSAFKNFKEDPSSSLKKDFEAFRDREKYWLTDYSLFITLKKKFQNARWNEWPRAFRDRDPRTLQKFSAEYSDDTGREEFAQFLFLYQWQKLKNYCNEAGIKIFGDIPIYINYDSADVWSHPELFKLKINKDIKAVAGVPPDYFSETGQLWNMPVFKWNVMKKDGFSWWKNRLRKNLELTDLLRLDHFRGFSAFWEVVAGEPTAVNGKWVKGPGTIFFDEVQKEFPEMPFVAEDLGQIDKPVYDLSDKYDLPGMKVLQFAFDNDMAHSVHIPHNHTCNSVVYTGTHDNNTIKGWYKKETGRLQRKNLRNYLGKKTGYRNCHTEMIRLAYSSVARLVIIPMQDILGLGSGARMNMPSVENGNWVWQLKKNELNPKNGNKIRKLAGTFGRLPRE